MPNECYRSEYVKCGKGCRGCPHGPYWYAYWREGRRTRKRYVGKVDPRRETTTAAPDWREAINNRATATVYVACRILGIHPDASRDDAASAFRRGMKKHHPDRGGDPKEAGFLSAAYTYLKSLFGW